MKRAEGPFEVLQRVNGNAYKIDLSGDYQDYQVSATFNVIDLSPYEDDDKLINLRSNFANQGEDDGGPSWTSQDNQNEAPNRQDLGWLADGKGAPPVADLGLCH